jgi:Uncharacterized proteins, LmbE homologs
MKVLILSPHTDDAELACGGSIIKFLQEGHELLWVVFSVAEESLPKFLPKDTLKKEFLEITKHLKLNEKITLYIILKFVIFRKIGRRYLRI